MISVHSILPSSRVNGPGQRMVVFFQGCERNCPGCFNPATHPLRPASRMTAEEILDRLPKTAEGITVSGGEPFLQPEGLRSLLTLAKERYGLSTVVYTGYTIEELGHLPEILSLIDVLIDGPYREEARETTFLARGSTNQRLHFLSGRYGEADFHMPGRVEISIDAEGRVFGTGFQEIPALGLCIP